MCCVIASSLQAATYGGGSGTLENPYQIWTPQQMNTIGIDPNDWSFHFKLMADINMSAYTGTQYKIIGNSTIPFTGTFDGNHHAISNLNYTSTSDLDYIGVFGYTENAMIRDLRVENASFSTTGFIIGGLAGYVKNTSIIHCGTTGTASLSCTTHDSYAGGLVGWQNDGSISDCTSMMMVTAFSSGKVYAGGVVAVQYSGGIENCHSTGQMSVSSSLSNSYAGGLVGLQRDSILNSSSKSPVSCESLGVSSDAYAGGLVGYQTMGSITASFSEGDVDCSSARLSCAGGLVGQQFADAVDTVNCYSTGSVTCSSSNASSYALAGGLVGYQSGGVITHCYSTGTVHTSGSAKLIMGGLVGVGGAVINSFWDSQTSGLDTSAGGTSRTTAQMKSMANYIAWNSPAQTNWTVDEDSDYPRLSWENHAGLPLGGQQFSDYVLGAGTVDDPYRIHTPQQLNIIGLFPDQWDKVFCLEKDIDLSVYGGMDYNRIGVGGGKNFTGTFDGKGHRIHNLTYSALTGTDFVGLFGMTENAVIKKVRLEGVNIDAGGLYVGGLTGIQLGGSVTDCTVAGRIACDSILATHVGGLIGQLDENGSISDCISNTSVSCVSLDASYAGGLTGYQESSSTITNCQSNGDVHVLSSTSSAVGGLVGESKGSIVTCCSTGAIDSSSSTSRAGGLVGVQFGGSCANSLSSGLVTSSSSSKAYAGGSVGYFYANSAKMNMCYSTGHVQAAGGTVYQGGLLGYYLGSSGSVTACFWDTQTSGQTKGVGSGSSGGMTGKTTPQMQMRLTFNSAGWNFATIWAICEGTHYPRLQWLIPAGDWICPDGVNTEDLDYYIDNWFLDNCTIANDFCGGADMNFDGAVDLADYSILAENWMRK